MSDLTEAAYYHQKAAGMHAQAERAESDQLRAAYLMIAEDWERLAEEVHPDQKEPGLDVLPPHPWESGRAAKL